MAASRFSISERRIGGGGPAGGAGAAAAFAGRGLGLDGPVFWGTGFFGALGFFGGVIAGHQCREAPAAARVMQGSGWAAYFTVKATLARAGGMGS
jgi:hypothetical protein